MSGTLIAAILGPFAPVLGVLAAWINLRSTQARNHEAIKSHITSAVNAAAALPAKDTAAAGGGGEIPAEVTIRITPRTGNQP